MFLCNYVSIHHCYWWGEGVGFVNWANIVLFICRKRSTILI